MVYLPSLTSDELVVRVEYISKNESNYVFDNEDDAKALSSKILGSIRCQGFLPKPGDGYWVPSFVAVMMGTYFSQWTGCDREMAWFRNGLIHPTRESAAFAVKSAIAAIDDFAKPELALCDAYETATLKCIHRYRCLRFNKHIELAKSGGVAAYVNAHACAQPYQNDDDDNTIMPYGLMIIV